jgi:F-type H+-transporting ATPase subunit delta
MRANTVARNYAEALLALANKAGDPQGWGTMINDVAGAIRRDRTLTRFLASPRIPERVKNDLLARAFADRLPRIFVRYLQALVHNRRQTLIPPIADAYNALLEESLGRVHADVTVVRPIDDEASAQIARTLTHVLGKTVVPFVHVDPAILGGVVVRVGDSVMDGSVRRRLATLRRRLAAGVVVAPTAAAGGGAGR